MRTSMKQVRTVLCGIATVLFFIASWWFAVLCDTHTAQPILEVWYGLMAVVSGSVGAICLWVTGASIIYD